MNAKVRHALAAGAALLVTVLVHVGDQLPSPWREVAAAVVAAATAYGINRPGVVPTGDDEAI